MEEILTESCVPETKQTAVSSIDNGVNDIRKGTGAYLSLKSERNI